LAATWFTQAARSPLCEGWARPRRRIHCPPNTREKFATYKHFVRIRKSCPQNHQQNPRLLPCPAVGCLNFSIFNRSSVWLVSACPSAVGAPPGALVLRAPRAAARVRAGVERAQVAREVVAAEKRSAFFKDGAEPFGHCF
jgi:hypothetical protein